MRISRFGLVGAAVTVVGCLAAPAFADGMRGSVKDAPVVVGSPGHCYLRADVGYSWSNDPDVRWTVTDPNPGPTQFQFVTDHVTNLRVDNSSSRFLGDIPEDLVDAIDLSGPQPSAPKDVQQAKARTFFASMNDLLGEAAPAGQAPAADGRARR